MPGIKKKIGMGVHGGSETFFGDSRAYSLGTAPFHNVFGYLQTNLDWWLTKPLHTRVLKFLRVIEGVVFDMYLARDRINPGYLKKNFFGLRKYHFTPYACPTGLCKA